MKLCLMPITVLGKLFPRFVLSGANLRFLPPHTMQLKTLVRNNRGIRSEAHASGNYDNCTAINL